MTTDADLDIVFVVDATGKLKSLTVVRSSGDKAYDAAVVEAMRSCRYRPAVRAGEPVEGLGWHRMRVKAPQDPVSGATRPTIGNVKSCAPDRDDYPVEARIRNQTGTTRIRFTIDGEGKLVTSEVVRSSGHPSLDETALRKLSDCTFLPGRNQEGESVGGTFEVDYIWMLQ